jgi:hypothetical protein
MGLVKILVLALNNYWGHSRARSRLDCLLGGFADCVYQVVVLNSVST